MRKVAVLLILVFVASCKRGEQPATATQGSARTGATGTQTAAPLEPGTTDAPAMPAYAAKNLDGTAFTLSDRREKVVLLNVWATWCGPCRYEIPELQALHDKYAPRGFEVIGASVDDADPQVVKDFAGERRMTYPIVLDPEGKIATILDASVLPTTVLIDRGGRIVWKKIGAIMPNDAELTGAIEKAL
jgi:thiol-disulfide isomerase/thioredoxin